jgi:GNAT superfamily N-acetyltransferase
MSVQATRSRVSLRPLTEDDLESADSIMRIAFGTFLGLPQPASFMGDAEYVRARFASDPAAAFAAEADGVLAGSNFATSWGSVGFFGPLTVRPELWDAGIGSRLMEPALDRFAAWGTRHAGLFTFAHSPKHVGLYQKFGFWPRALTAIMELTVGPAGPPFRETVLSALDERTRDEALASTRALADAIYEGLDPTREIEHVARHGLGQTILIDDGGRIAGVAICHCGAGSEAGSGTCFVKFGAVRPGPAAGKQFEILLDACEALAREQTLQRVVAGTSVARLEAYQAMRSRGYRTWLQGVAMHKADDDGYHRRGVYAIDDWR